ncbi:hypothetical protein [Promicromonospora soli]
MKRNRSARGDARQPARRLVRTLLTAVVGGALVVTLAACSGEGAGDSGGAEAAYDEGAANGEAVEPGAAREDITDATGGVGIAEAPEEAVNREHHHRQRDARGGRPVRYRRADRRSRRGGGRPRRGA